MSSANALGPATAGKSIDDGAARRTLRKMISFSNGE